MLGQGYTWKLKLSHLSPPNDLKSPLQGLGCSQFQNDYMILEAGRRKCHVWGHPSCSGVVSDGIRIKHPNSSGLLASLRPCPEDPTEWTSLFLVSSDSHGHTRPSQP